MASVRFSSVNPELVELNFHFYELGEISEIYFAVFQRISSESYNLDRESGLNLIHNLT